MEATRRIAGVGFQAVCDIWPYNRTWVAARLRRYGHACNAYEDYREMLDKEDLQAAIVATPDFWHARHAIACLEAGLHVYCETPMAHTVADARRMVEALRRVEAGAEGSSPLLQIGQHCRSDPHYRYCFEKLLQEMKLPGRIVAVNGQWNHAFLSPLGWPKNADSIRRRCTNTVMYRWTISATALVPGAERRAHRGPRGAPDRCLQLVPRGPAAGGPGQWPAELL